MTSIEPFDRAYRLVDTFTMGKAIAKLSVPVRKIVRDDPPPKKQKRAPKGAVMQASTERGRGRSRG